MNNKSISDLYILGSGVLFPEHLTLETLDILQACLKICTNLPQSKIELLPESIKSKVINFSSLYKQGRVRLENYRDVIDAVLNAVTSDGPTVWLTPGHPSVFDRVTSTLLLEGRSKGFKVSIFPGISCIDTILADVEYEPANGLIVHEATSLVKKGLPLNSNFSTMLLQPSVFFSERAHLSLESVNPDLAPLKDYLLNFYDKMHKVAFIRSYSDLNLAPNIYWVSIDQLTTTPSDQIAGSTLWIPRVK